MPRGRILKDDALLEIAASRPASKEKLLQSRALQREGRKPEVLEEILAAVSEGLSNPVSAPPKPRKAQKQGGQAMGELLRVLLKAKAEELGVAQRLIANAEDLDLMANEDEPDVKALKGWRREAFGEDALRLMRGEIALSASEGGVKIIKL